MGCMSWLLPSSPLPGLPLLTIPEIRSPLYPKHLLLLSPSLSISSTPALSDHSADYPQTYVQRLDFSPHKPSCPWHLPLEILHPTLNHQLPNLLFLIAPRKQGNCIDTFCSPYPKSTSSVSYASFSSLKSLFPEPHLS